MRRWGLVLGLWCLAAPALGEAREEASIESLQEALRRQVAADKTEQALARIDADETSIIEELEAAEEEMREAQAAHRLAQQRAAEAHAALEPARAAEAEAAQALAKELQVLRPRLISRYRLLRLGQGEPGEDPATSLRLRHGFDRILAGDLAQLRRAKQAQRELESARRRWEALAEAARREGEEAATRFEEAAARREERDRLLRGIQGEKRLVGRTQRELRKARAELEAKLARLQRRKAHGVWADRYGKLPWPVADAVVEVPFGKVVNAKFHTVTSHNGLDLRVAEGTPVLAVAQGVVAYAGWFRGYGNLVIVDHGAGTHTLHGHLASVDVEAGAEVAEGEVLGKVGDTGSLKGAYLYFELRREGQPTDPLPWLGRRPDQRAE
jgi:septal ring factor EnvC (AmiA/AmiB activator)